MHTTEQNKLKLIETQLAEHQRQSWTMLAVGISLGFVGLHYLMARPMGRQMEGLQRDLAIVEQRMQDLVGLRDDVWDTNSLLAGLKSQKEQLDEARVALQSIGKLQGDLVAEASRK